MYDATTLDRLQRDVAAMVGRWGVPVDSAVSLLTTSENATFLVSAPARRIVVRVHRPDYHREGEILSELAWIADLRGAGIVRTPAPVLLDDGAIVAEIGVGPDRRQAVAFEFEAGREPDPGEDLTGWFRALGAVNARLHRHSRDWTRPAGFVRKVWDVAGTLGPDAHWGDWRDGIGGDAALRALFERAEDRLRVLLADYGTAPDRFGLIHADLRLANLLVDGDRLSVIDFDDCGFGWFAYDFAAAVSFHEEASALDAWMAAWIAGYREVAPLADSDAAMIPAFVMLRRLMLTAWLAGHAETPTAAAAGPDFAQGTARVAARFLQRFG